MKIKIRIDNNNKTISKGYLLQLINNLKLKEKGLVSMNKFFTPQGMQKGYIIHAEGGRILTIEIRKILPEEKKQYLIESTKPKEQKIMRIYC